MRALPEGLAAQLRGGVTTLCHGWRLTRRDGRVLGFTDHDRDLVVDGLVLHAASGIASSESTQAQGLSVTGTEVSGALSAVTLEEADLAAGQYDGAAIDLLLIDWSNPVSHALLRRGTIGEVRREGQAFTAEVRALSDALNQTNGRVFGALCDADLGDGRCGVNLGLSQFRADGSVVAVDASGRMQVAGLWHPDGWFTRGRCRFTTGANTGFITEVKVHDLDAGIAALQLWQRPPAPVLPGDAFDITAGCDKTFATCRDRFSNALNFRGCPHMPGNDFVLAVAVPGEASYDGSTLA
ncbi:DUF2163 domain-containing protein [Azorhizobium sp. AG788]|uniref:DUF2163 domain-containing protein n=1 Tax=Azorhizobium sp. AG788 TaxID=2183897 RepID=UPI003139ACA6